MSFSVIGNVPNSHLAPWQTILSPSFYRDRAGHWIGFPKPDGHVSGAEPLSIQTHRAKAGGGVNKRGDATEHSWNSGGSQKTSELESLQSGVRGDSACLPYTTHTGHNTNKHTPLSLSSAASWPALCSLIPSPKVGLNSLLILDHHGNSAAPTYTQGPTYMSMHTHPTCAYIRKEKKYTNSRLQKRLQLPQDFSPLSVAITNSLVLGSGGEQGYLWVMVLKAAEFGNGVLECGGGLVPPHDKVETLSDLSGSASSSCKPVNAFTGFILTTSVHPSHLPCHSQKVKKKKEKKTHNNR